MSYSHDQEPPAEYADSLSSYNKNAESGYDQPMQENLSSAPATNGHHDPYINTEKLGQQCREYGARAKSGSSGLKILGVSIILTLAALVLTLIILVVGRHGNANSDLALLDIDMTNFAVFHPPTINLVDATKVRRDFIGDIGDGFGAATSAVGGEVTAIATAVGDGVASAETAAASLVADAGAEADKIVGEIGDAVENIEAAVEGLMDKVLGSIQDKLNKWLQEAASGLSDMDIMRKMSLHLTTSCTSPAGPAGNSTNTTQLTCSPIFTSGNTTFNSTANDGEIFGFSPGNIIAEALGVFFVPKDAQDHIREPVDKAANEVQKLVTQISSEAYSWSVNLLFIPIVAVFVLAVVCMCLLLLLLGVLAFASAKCPREDFIPVMVYTGCAYISGLATFFLFLGSVILTVIGLLAHVAALGGDSIGIIVTSGSSFKSLSWAAFIIMLLVTVVLKIKEYVELGKAWLKLFKVLIKHKGNVKNAFAEHGPGVGR